MDAYVLQEQHKAGDGGGGSYSFKTVAKTHRRRDSFDARLFAKFSSPRSLFSSHNTRDSGIAGGPWAGVRLKAPPGPPGMVRRGGGGRGVVAHQGEAHRPDF